MMTTNQDAAVLSDAAKAEIAEAVRIVASDKAYQNTKAIRDHLIPPTPETDPPKDGEPTPPPSSKKEGESDPPADPPKEDKEPKKVGLWWGDRLDNDE